MSETLGDLFYRFCCLDNPDDKLRGALRFANQLDAAMLRLQRLEQGRPPPDRSTGEANSKSSTQAPEEGE